MLNKDKQYIVKIDNLGYEGEGVARVDGYPVFVQGALIGETVKIEIIKAKKKFAYGRVLEIIEASGERVEAGCEYYEKCGGCTLQHATYKAQLDFKFNRVKDCISKIAGLDDNLVKYPIGMTCEYNYRNKGQFAVGIVNGKLSIGFFSEKTHEIKDIEECLIQDKQCKDVISAIRRWMNENSIIPAKVDGFFNGDGLIRHIVIRKGYNTDELMVILVTTNKEIPEKDKLINELESSISNLKSIVQNINDKDTNMIMGEKCVTLWGSDFISDYIDKFKFNISPLSFFQVNPVQTDVLYSKALEYANLSGNEVVFDAYCGTGTISLFLSQRAKKVYGVEIIEQAIDNAKINAKENNIDNVEFFVGKSEEIIPRLIRDGIKADVIVVDPPRKGCDSKLLEAIGEAKPDRVVYVSCDPSTLARDLKYLNTVGYEIEEVQPVDMFPMTKHVENVVLITRKDS